MYSSVIIYRNLVVVRKNINKAEKFKLTNMFVPNMFIFSIFPILSSVIWAQHGLLSSLQVTYGRYIIFFRPKVWPTATPKVLGSIPGQCLEFFLRVKEDGGH
jgi:hypothetical protein